MVRGNSYGDILTFYYEIFNTYTVINIYICLYIYKKVKRTLAYPPLSIIIENYQYL